MSIQDTAAVVTGATKGVGRGVAPALVQEGRSFSDDAQVDKAFGQIVPETVVRWDVELGRGVRRGFE